jgi:rare lipoprotein A
VRSGKQVIVRINDRGPFHSNRAIDLSYAAAYRLGFIGTGSGEVEIEAIVP